MSILKWVGGKSQIMKEIIKHIPNKIDSYYEPFLGGASVLIELLELTESGEFSINNFIANDINRELVNLYKNIMSRHNELIDCLNNLSKEFIVLPEEKSKEKDETKDENKGKKIIPPEYKEHCGDKKVFYYWIRKEYNRLKKEDENDIITSAYFIFLNKAGFRGLYRENSNNEFNVPYGNYKNPKILNEQAITRLNYLFNKYNVVFTNFSFEIFINEFKLRDDDFIYMDPPYYPVNDSSFTAYSAVDFGLLQHKDLLDLLKTLDDKGIKFLMSNSYTNYVIKRTKKFKSKKINCKRRINSKNPESMEFEILVFN